MTAKEFAEKWAGRMAKGRIIGITGKALNDEKVGRIVAYIEERGYIIIEKADDSLRDAKTLGGVNVVPDARSGFYSKPELITILDEPTVAAKPKDNPYPGICPRCQAPAYVGLHVVDCSKRCILKGA